MLLTYAILAISTSIDAIGIGITYGIRHIVVSKKVMMILFGIAVIISGVAIFIGNTLAQLFPKNITKWIGGILLILMGIGMIFQKPDTFDLDNSKHIDMKEAVYLGIALSVDSFSVGIGTGMIGTSSFLFPFFVALFQILFLWLGKKIGMKIQEKSHMPNFGWSIISAVLLIGIGVCRLVF